MTFSDTACNGDLVFMTRKPTGEFLAKRIEELEKSLFESEERYQVLIEGIDLGVTMIDADYNIIMVNQIIAEWFGKMPHELIGKKCYREFEKKEQTCQNCPGSKAMATGKKQEEVVKWKKSDGSSFHARNKTFPLYGANGDIIGFHELVEDITKKKLAEEKLLSEKNFLDSLLKSLPGVMYLFDESGRFLIWNDTFAEVTGFSDAEIKKMQPLDFIAPDDRELVRKAIEKTFREKGAVVDARLTAKDGTESHYHFTGIGFTNNGSKYLVGMGVDISDRILAEKEKENLIIKLQDALSRVKLLSGFLPICASCKKIRDDKGYWNQIESYIRTHSEAEFTHSICPECTKKLYPGLVTSYDREKT